MIIEVGQVWRRGDDLENCTFYEVTNERTVKFIKEYELTPIEYGGFPKRGRKTWKWSGGIASGLTFISHKTDTI